jgi:AcrR family transcriptional regulator
MSVDFFWGDRPAPTRGPKPALSLDLIADAGIAIADAEGLAAVSMQRVATDLGYTKMSLYRYLPGKAELIALMVERGMGEPPPPSPAGWRESLALWTRQLMAAFVAHPWSLAATVGARPLGPRELGWMESALTVLAGTPLTGAERLDAMVILVGHARMLAAQVTPEAQLGAAIAAVIRQRGEQFPQLKAAMTEAAAAAQQDQAFDFGLARILDGLQCLIDARAAGAPAAATGSQRPGRW